MKEDPNLWEIEFYYCNIYSKVEKNILHDIEMHLLKVPLKMH